MASRVAWPGLRPLYEESEENDYRTRGQSQMIGVVQAQATASLFELMRSQAFERSLGCNRHEDGQRNFAMGQLKSSSTCLGDLDGGSVFTFVFSAPGTTGSDIPSTGRLAGTSGPSASCQLQLLRLV